MSGPKVIHPLQTNRPPYARFYFIIYHYYEFFFHPSSLSISLSLSLFISASPSFSSALSYQTHLSIVVIPCNSIFPLGLPRLPLSSASPPMPRLNNQPRSHPAAARWHTRHPHGHRPAGTQSLARRQHCSPLTRQRHPQQLQTKSVDWFLVFLSSTFP